ncbi:LexA family protein [Morganella morganii]|uniref:LexA family protein n=1 Tax=Morganella morganii TaxID=582 RepID=UPI003EC060BF
MNTLGERIKFRRRQLKMTQRDVAECVGISASAVTQWEGDSTGLSSENLLRLSAVLRCSPQWLLLGEGELDLPFPPYGNHYAQIPVISWVQAGNWTEVINQPDVNSLQYVDTSAKVSGNAFALIVKGQSMTSTSGELSIPEGAIVVVDPEFGFVDEMNNKIIIAQLSESNEATIKKFIIDGPNRYLAPLNPQFNPIPVNGNCRLIGQVKQIIINLD